MTVLGSHQGGHMKKALKLACAVAVALAAFLLAYRHFVLVGPILDNVRETLTDPDSAQFRNLQVYGDGLPGDTVVCGEVNAKNRLGGYVGFRHFRAGWGPNEVEFDPEGECALEGLIRLSLPF